MATGAPVVEFPSVRQEAWRYTPVDEIITRMGNATAGSGGTDRLTRQAVDDLTGDHGGGPRLVFVNGRYDGPLSDHAGLPRGIWFGAANPAGSLADWAAPPEVDGFIARNRASGDPTATVVVGPSTQFEQPLHIIHVSVPGPDSDLGHATLSQPRTVIDVGDGCRVAILETYCGLDGATVTNASTSIRLGRRAELDHCRVQAEPATAVHIARTRIDQAEGAQLRLVALTIGGDIARNAIAVRLGGPDAHAELAGISRTAGRQRHDTVVTMDHASSRGTSTQHFAGIVDGHGRGSFSGEIIVRAATTGTDAHQSSRNLILGPHAEADTRPWLQILAEDVRCTHGATVGRLDDDALFYLRSRGIPVTSARRMLTDAFVQDVIDRIAHAALRDHVAVVATEARTARVDRS